MIAIRYISDSKPPLLYIGTYIEKYILLYQASGAIFFVKNESDLNINQNKSANISTSQNTPGNCAKGPLCISS